MKKDIFEDCPIYQNENLLIRLISKDDLMGLYKVYSDVKAMPYFNSDNCNDNFCYDTIKKMEDGLNFWLNCYIWKGFTRLTIIDKENDIIIGTIEIFRREKDENISDCCLLRVDLRSDYEKEEYITMIMSLIEESLFTLFDVNIILTKIPEFATARKVVFNNLGYKKLSKGMKLNGVNYLDYYFKEQ